MTSNMAKVAENTPAILLGTAAENPRRSTVDHRQQTQPKQRERTGDGGVVDPRSGRPREIGGIADLAEDDQLRQIDRATDDGDVAQQDVAGVGGLPVFAWGTERCAYGELVA
jgi:hypothetical protein